MTDISHLSVINSTFFKS